MSKDTGKTWEFLASQTSSYYVENAHLDYNGRIFRVFVSTPSFPCGSTIESDTFTITVLPDYERDGIPDAIDLDDVPLIDSPTSKVSFERTFRYLLSSFHATTVPILSPVLTISPTLN